MPPLISISRAEPPGLTLRPMAERADHDALDQRWSSTSERLDAAAHDQPADRLADLDANGPIGMSDDAIELGEVHGAGIDIEATRALPKVSIGALTFNSCTMPKLTKPMPLGPYEVIFCSAVSGPPRPNCRAPYR